MRPTYFVGLFDVLGFESRFAHLGLDGMFARYRALVRQIDQRNAHNGHLSATLSIEDDACWAAGGETMIFNRVNGLMPATRWCFGPTPVSPEAQGMNEAQ